LNAPCENPDTSHNQRVPKNTSVGLVVFLSITHAHAHNDFTCVRADMTGCVAAQRAAQRIVASSAMQPPPRTSWVPPQLGGIQHAALPQRLPLVMPETSSASAGLAALSMVPNARWLLSGSAIEPNTVSSNRCSGQAPGSVSRRCFNRLSTPLLAVPSSSLLGLPGVRSNVRCYNAGIPR